MPPLAGVALSAGGVGGAGGVVGVGVGVGKVDAEAAGAATVVFGATI